MAADKAAIFNKTIQGKNMIQGVVNALAVSAVVTMDNAVFSDRDHVKQPGSSTAQPDEESISLLAKQLSESALRSNRREQELSRDELAAYAQKQLYDFALDGYTFAKSRHDLELPDTNDPEHLARAKQATNYVNQSISGNRNAKNPFAGLSRDQLALIAYDDSGGFTINERRAAWCEGQRMKSEWSKGAVTRCQLESAQTASIPVFLTEVLSFYRGLPKIEQVQDCYPGDYEAELLEKISAERARPDGESTELAERGMSLYDILASISVSEKQRDESKPSPSLQTGPLQESASAYPQND